MAAEISRRDARGRALGDASMRPRRMAAEIAGGAAADVAGPAALQ